MKYKNRKLTEVRISITSGILAGTALSLIISLLVTGWMTSLALNGRIGMEQMDVVIFFVRALSVMVGALVATGLYKEKMLMTVEITVGCYMLCIVALGILAFSHLQICWKRSSTMVVWDTITALSRGGSAATSSSVRTAHAGASVQPRIP